MVKQAIIVRKDMNLKRKEIISQATKASIKFIVENNESERCGQLLVNLSSDETAWLTGSFLQDIMFVETKEQLENIMFKAEILGIEVYPVFSKMGNNMSETSCVALGPDEPEIINKLIHGLKSL